MTNTGGTPAGWYHAPGDAEGTQRYWDGAQWIGEPQATPQQSQTPQPGAADDATVAYTPPPQQDSTPPAYGGPPAGDPASYGAPGGQPGFQQATPAGGGFVPGGTPAGAPPGYQAFDASGANGVPAEWVDRLVAYLIDIAPVIGIYILIAIAGVISDTLGLLVALVGYLAVLGYVIWNMYIVQGKTGQSIGKKNRGIKLIKDETGQPVGGLMAFVRYLVVGAFYLLCCIGGLVNLLAPLWNANKKTYSDQILNMSVVKV